MSPIKNPILYHYFYLTCQLQIVQYIYSLIPHTYQHIFFFTRRLRCSDDHNSTIILYPYHPHPHLILKQKPHHGTFTTISYHSSTAPTYPAKQRSRLTITILSHTDRVIILHPFTTTQNQHIILIITIHLLLTTDNLNDIWWTSLNTPRPLALISSV